ncbi:hypothetical protein LTR48_007225 [Friedmanniomyces endolithicus]|uniref:Uncharacterized protein n=1 Tax=Rachicladosporium monterosium TaxID=1507873 RepID=A0ABR0KWS4_9PEZI|nr:hypothetical protein LTR48_007225 [Friedmanniomyces endolithicus]KAK5139798.1 hypothetical protein LTR32_007209 [Rachicladosporium monterosium]
MDSKNPASHKEDGAMIPIKDIPSMSLGRPLVRVPLVPRLAAATPLFAKRAFSQNQTRAPQVSRYAALFAEQAKAKAAKEAEMDPRAVKAEAETEEETEAESEAGVEAEDDYDIMSWSGRKGDSPAY